MNRTLAIAFAAAAAAALCAACSHHPAPAATQASAQPAAATPAPQTGEDAQQAYQACLANTAAEVDNSRDSLAALTETVASACHPQFLQYADINEQPYAPHAQPGELDAASAAIQAHRKLTATRPAATR